MADIWMMIIGMGVLMLALAFGAAWIGRRLPQPVAVVLAGLVAAAMLLGGRYLAGSVFVASILPPRALPVFGNVLPLLAGLLAGFGWVLSPRHRVINAIVLGGFLLAAIALPYRPLFGDRPAVRDRWTRTDVCLQTTNATCGPAAAATALAALGISTTEREMADLCFTSDRGTGLHGLLRGLAVKLADTPWKARVAQLKPDNLSQLENPAILFVGIEDVTDDNRYYVTHYGWIPGVEHTVVVFGADGRTLDVGDPAAGRERWSYKALDTLWRGIAIVIERRAGGEQVVEPESVKQNAPRLAVGAQAILR